MVWYEKTRADIGMRIAGLALLAISAGLFDHLFGAGAHVAAASDYLCAAIAFPAASAGTALASLGRHLLDPMPVAPRWALIPRRANVPHAREDPH